MPQDSCCPQPPNSLPSMHTRCFPPLLLGKGDKSQPTCAAAQVCKCMCKWKKRLSEFKGGIEQFAWEIEKGSACIHMWIPWEICLCCHFIPLGFIPQAVKWQRKPDVKPCMTLYINNSVLSKQMQGLGETSNGGWKYNNMCLLVIFMACCFFISFNKHTKHIFSVISVLNRILICYIASYIVHLKRHLRMNIGALVSFPPLSRDISHQGGCAGLPEACLAKQKFFLELQLSSHIFTATTQVSM